jgi:hypothetical protein
MNQARYLPISGEQSSLGHAGLPPGIRPFYYLHNGRTYERPARLLTAPFQQSAPLCDAVVRGLPTGYAEAARARVSTAINSGHYERCTSSERALRIG